MLRRGEGLSSRFIKGLHQHVETFSLLQNEVFRTTQGISYRNYLPLFSWMRGFSKTIVHGNPEQVLILY